MKFKKMFIVLSFVVAGAIIVVCGDSLNAATTESSVADESDASDLAALEELGYCRADRFYVVYAKDTKRMYAVSANPYNAGAVALLVNADGSPMLYEEE